MQIDFVLELGRMVCKALTHTWRWLYLRVKAEHRSVAVVRKLDKPL